MQQHKNVREHREMKMDMLMEKHFGLNFFFNSTVKTVCGIQNFKKQKYKPQTKSFRSTFRMLCPASHSGCAQLTFTEC